MVAIYDVHRKLSQKPTRRKTAAHAAAPQIDDGHDGVAVGKER
jgi:hypothetical protein